MCHALPVKDNERVKTAELAILTSSTGDPLLRFHQGTLVTEGGR